LKNINSVIITVMKKMRLTKSHPYPPRNDLWDDLLESSEIEQLFGESNRVIRDTFLRDVEEGEDIIDTYINVDDLLLEFV